MPADDVLPWTLLLSKLRRSDDSRVSYDEVLRTGWEPEVLVVRERVLESIETSSVHLDVINYLLRIDYLIYDVCLHLLGRGLPEIADQNAAFN